MAECMINLLSKKGTIIIEVQYLMNMLKDLTFDNIYHEHYNYWSLTSLVNFFNQLKLKIFRSEKVDTHGGSIRVYIKKDKKIKIEKSVNKILNNDPQVNNLVDELYKINSKLWDIENSKRRCEAENNFGWDFIQLARDVYIYNDKRAEIKRKINVLTYSDVVEEKEYTNYK